MVKNVTSYEIVRNHSYSWTYYYTINGRRRDVTGSSLENLKKQVLDMDLPWDYENYPDEKITNSYYDDERLTSRLGAYTRLDDADDGRDSSEPDLLPRYARSRKRW